MWAKLRPSWKQYAPMFWKKTVDSVGQAFSCKEQAIVFVQGNQSAVEHPMHRTGQSDAIPDAVWTLVSYRTDMRRLNLRSAASVYESETCDGTRVIVCRLDGNRECTIPKWPTHQLLD